MVEWGASWKPSRIWLFCDAIMVDTSVTKYLLKVKPTVISLSLP